MQLVNDAILMKRGKFSNWIIKNSHFLDQLRSKDSGSVIDLLAKPISIELLLKQVRALDLCVQWLSAKIE